MFTMFGQILNSCIYNEIFITPGTILKLEKIVSWGVCFLHLPAGGAAVAWSAGNEYVPVGGEEITDSGCSRVWTLEECRFGLSQSSPLVHSSYKRPYKQVTMGVMIDWVWGKHEACVGYVVQWLWAYMSASSISALAHNITKLLLYSHK